MANDSFTRWQERLLNLRTHTINVFLGIDLATIGFIVSKILEKDFAFKNSFGAICLMSACILLLVNTIIILLLMLNRLNGFRKTTAIARKRSDTNIAGEELQKLRDESLENDNRTYWLFEVSTVLFSVGEFLAVIGFIIQIWSKISFIF
jgi:hypothetical protein